MKGIRIRDWRPIFSTIVLAAVVGSAIFAQWIAPHDPTQQDIRRKLIPPMWMPDGQPTFPLGTDELGRDILSRIIYGSRISLAIGTTAVGIGVTVGTLLGLIAGFYRQWVDNLIMRVADIQLAFPFLLLAIAVIGVLGPGLRNTILVLGFASWMIYARVIRAEVLSVRERDYVLAARAVGVQAKHLMWRHILPNVVHVVIVIATLEIARMILVESALSFLGLGVQPPTPSWGGMLSDSQQYLATAWWLTTWPGAAIAVTVLAVNLLGDWLRDVLDPRRRQ